MLGLDPPTPLCFKLLKGNEYKASRQSRIPVLIQMARDRRSEPPSYRQVGCERLARMSEKCILTSDMSLPAAISARLDAGRADRVWTPVDFLDLGSRASVDKVLQRLVAAGALRRIDRGLYDTPRANRLTGQRSVPDYRQVIDALARRDQSRMLVDGLTAANDLGLTTSVPARVVVHTDTRRRPIQLGALRIEFKLTAPSRLYWAGRPAMRLVQALHWLRDSLPRDAESVRRRIVALLREPATGRALRDDLRAGFATLPAWMQDLLRDLLTEPDSTPKPRAVAASGKVGTTRRRARRAVGS